MNDAPVAVDDTAVVARDVTVPAGIDVLANDTDVDGDALTVVAVTQGANGAVSIPAGGLGVSYLPAPGFVGTDVLTYTIEDAAGVTATAAVTVTVLGVRFVRHGWTGDGTSWDQALGHPQDAVDAAAALPDVKEVWVAAGTYEPLSGESSALTLSHGVEVYGGFAGDESTREGRDWGANQTILDGGGDALHGVKCVPPSSWCVHGRGQAVFQ